MSVCNKAWTEKYVTHERNVSIKVLHHRCVLQTGHDTDSAKKQAPCQCRCAPFRVRS